MAGEEKDVLSVSGGARARRGERLNQQSKPQTACSLRNVNNCGLSNARHFHLPWREPDAESGIHFSQSLSFSLLGVSDHLIKASTV